MANNIYPYRAFISHTGKDEEWAKRLNRKLTDYIVPRAARKKYGIPKKLGNFFFYENGMAGSNKLNKALEDKIAESECLIVICSPTAAKKPWINDEINSFISQHDGNTDKIFPFIVSGNPDSPFECYPDALASISRMSDGRQNLRGPNIQLRGDEHAIIELIALILGIDFEELKNYELIRTRRRKILLGFIIFLFALIAILSWQYFRVKKGYYADYVDCWGVPKGIIAVDKEQRSHRSGTYRFEYRRIPLGQPDATSWRLDRVCYINSAGKPTKFNNFEGDEGRYPIQEFVYSADNGALTQIVCCSNTGKVLARHKISRHNDVAASIADVESADEGGGIGIAQTMSFTGVSIEGEMSKKSKITRFAYERDENGYIISTTYHSNNDPDLEASATPDNNGVWGVRYTRDSLGRCTAIYYQDKENLPMNDRMGVASRHYKYDEFGTISEVSYLDKTGNLTLSDALWAKATSVTDMYGNTLRRSVFDNDEKPCLAIDGTSITITKYDSRGNCIEKEYYYIDGKPCLSNERVAKIVGNYDVQGNCIEQAYYGINGKPCLSKFGIAKVAMKYDSRGNGIEQACYGIDGKPCLSKFGYAKVVDKYDSRGNKIEEACYGIDGKPCLGKYGYAKVVNKYDTRGNRIEQACYGIDGKPCLGKDGVAKVVNKYDTLGNLVENTCYGINEKPCLNIDGYAKVVVKYDTRGNRIEQAYYGIDGKPCLGKDGGSKWVNKYDTLGNLVENTCYGINGKPCLHNGGYTKNVIKYDARGNMVECVCYGIDENPCFNNDGFAKVVNKYDVLGNITEQAYYGIDGKPCLYKNGYAKFVNKYNARGNIIEQAHYGIDGKPCFNNDGFAKVVNKYDAAQGNHIEQAYYGIDGKPCLCKDGYAKVKFVKGIPVLYDENGKMINNKSNKSSKTDPLDMILTGRK